MTKLLVSMDKDVEGGKQGKGGEWRVDLEDTAVRS